LFRFIRLGPTPPQTLYTFMACTITLFTIVIYHLALSIFFPCVIFGNAITAHLNGANICTLKLFEIAIQIDQEPLIETQFRYQCFALLHFRSNVI
jgi:hypothetical protein